MGTVTGTGPHASFDFADQVRQRIRVVVLAAAVLTAEDNHPSHTIRPVCYVELVTSRLIFLPPALDPLQ